MKKQENKEAKKQVNKFKLKFILMILLMDAITVVILYIIMPQIQNFPPYSEDFAFQEEVQVLTHVEQYTLIYCIAVVIHIGTFQIFLKNIYKYLYKYYNKEQIDYDEIRRTRKDCINIPYKLFFIQMGLIISIGIIFNFIMLASPFAIIKFTLMIIAIASIISIILLIASQKSLTGVLLSTYEVSNEYEKNIGYRITNSKNLILQMVPFLAVILIIISLIGYAKASEQKGYSKGNYYKAYMENKIGDVGTINEENLKKMLATIPLQDETDYYFIIHPNDEKIYVSSEEGSISNFVLKYRDYFYDKTDGYLYEQFGVDEQLYAMKVTDQNGGTWYIGFKYQIIDMELLYYYAAIIVIMLIPFIIILMIWSKNVSSNLMKITESLKNIAEEDKVRERKILPITSNDECGDLSYYYNKIQETTQKHIIEIQDGQERLMERERLSSLGQLVGGIAHNLKTPIMSISGASEGLNDLIKEYDMSIDDPEVNSQDHHEIAHDMNVWVEKIKKYTEYMSDVITAVKGQATTANTENVEKFTVLELSKRVEILMKHELKNAHVELETKMNISENTIIKGNVTSLVQIINNMLSNSIQAYNGKENQKIELTFDKKGNNITISVKDYAGGISESVKNKLFKEMITTKGKNGTGLGLFMSYSTIKAKFDGDMICKTEEGVGTEFIISIPM